MSNGNKIGRRAACATIFGASGGLLLTGSASGRPRRRRKVCCGPTPALSNDDFYKDGKFLPERARQAYFDMFRRFNYPNPEPQQKLLWIQDFALGDFVHAGMAGTFWFNDKENNYFGHEIYLLPGQQIPEHAHVKTKDAVAKMEAWHCRYGMIHCLGEGPETKPMPVELPESQEPFRTVKHAHRVLPGEVYSLNRPGAFHFMIAGPEGAIVTEYATYHDPDALRFSNPGVRL